MPAPTETRVYLRDPETNEVVCLVRLIWPSGVMTERVERQGLLGLDVDA